jgi:predicted DNA-binding transcriptional regulator AlpA
MAVEESPQFNPDVALSQSAFDHLPGALERIAEVIVEAEQRKAAELGRAVLEVLSDALSSDADGLVGRSGAAQILGISMQRTYQLVEAGRFPRPFALIDGRRPVWFRSDIEVFRLDR